MLTLPVRIFLACLALGIIAFVVVSAGGPDGNEDCSAYADRNISNLDDYLDNTTAELDCLENSSSQGNAAWLTLGGFVAVGAAGAFVAGQRREDATQS